METNLNFTKLTAQEIIDTFPRKVQSQVMMNEKDGFPERNERFLGGMDEVISVILDIKPLCGTSIDSINFKDEDLYINNNYKSNQICEIVKIKKSKNLYYTITKKGKKFNFTDEGYSFLNTTIMFFNKKYINKAILFYYMQKPNQNIISLTNDYIMGSDNDEFSIINGTLLGYPRDSICSWFMYPHLMEHLGYQRNIDYNSIRDEIIKNPEGKKFRDEYIKKFNKRYNKVIKKIPTYIKKALAIEKEKKLFEKNTKLWKKCKY
jgi:hypothetical protein